MTSAIDYMSSLCERQGIEHEIRDGGRTLYFKGKIQLSKEPERVDTHYGCLNRPHFGPAHVMARACQYTLTQLGQADKRCEGCAHKQQETK